MPLYVPSSGGGAVSSVNTRTGAVTGLAEASDLTAEATTARSAEAAKAMGLTPTAVKTADYSAAAGDFVPVDTTSNAVTVTLPTAPADKTRVAFKHVIQGGTNAVTYACGGSDVLNKTGGATTGTLTLLSQAAVLQYKASGAIWYIQSADVPLAQLDLRYAPVAAKNALYGDGADGNVTIAAGTTTLTRDMQYNNLVVNGTIETAGFRVHVRGTLTGAGAISSVGGNAALGVGGPAGGGSAGIYTGQTGGGNGGAAGGSTGTNGASNRQLGAAGGAGGLGASGAGGAGGTVSAVTTDRVGLTTGALDKLHPLELWVGRAITDGSPARFGGGSGGGGGGGDGTTGGGGGGGGGVVALFAYDASGFTGTISARGGNGAAPSAGGNRGGGGGGGGGFVGFFAAILPTGAYTITAAAGTGAAPTGSGVAGSDGSNGTTIAAVV